MKVVKVLEKSNSSTLAVIENNDELLIAQVDNASGSVLEVWELSQEDIQKYL